MAERPKRQRKAPDRFGELVSSEAVADPDDPDFPKRRRSTEDDAPISPRRRRRRQDPAAAPSQPLPRADVLAILHACPELMDCIVEPDDLRSVTLLARDVASLATALCAPAADVAELWRLLASACPGGGALTDAAPMEEVLQVVQAAVAADPVRGERCCMSTAKTDYRLSDTDLAPLPYHARPNPYYRSGAPMKLYAVLDVVSVAHRKYGCADRIEEARQRAQERYQKARATQADNEERRRAELAVALEREGLDVARFRYQRECTAWVKHGQGQVGAIARLMKDKQAQDLARQQRREQLSARLIVEGLGAELYRSMSATRYIQTGSSGAAKAASSSGAVEAGSGGGSRRQSAAGPASALDAAVAAVRAEVALRQQRAERRARVDEMLAAEGLSGYQYLHAVQNFIHSGAATEQSVLEDVRAAHAQRLAELAAVDAAAQAGPLAAAQAAAAAMQAAAAAAAVHAAGGG